MLPFLNGERGSAKKQVVSFRGINFSDRYTDGDLRDCMNMSARRYPYLTTRRARKRIEEHTGASAFLYRDKPIVVIGTDLIYDGNVVAQVTEGEKQFAVVNTKLCVFPDKIYYDVKTGETGKLDGGVNSTVGAYDLAVTRGVVNNEIVSTISTQNLSASNVDRALTQSAIIMIAENAAKDTRFYTYGKDYKAVEACWDNANSAWDMGKLALLETTRTWETFTVGEIVILNDQGYIVKDGTYQVKDYGTKGLYAPIHSITDANGGQTLNRGHYMYGTEYRVNGGAHSFTEVFKVGDAITITGTRGGIYNTENALLSVVAGDTLTFGGDVFQVLYNGNNIIDEVDSVTAVATGLKPGDYYVQYANEISKKYSYGTFITFNVTVPVSGRYSLFMRKSSSGIYVLDLTTRQVVERCEVLSSGTNRPSGITGKGPLYEITRSETSSSVISFAKPCPDLDFVCESENRLWGCSNKDKTIYASALGDPTNFFVYEGLSTDGYAVAVGTEGDFTGCCKHSSSVLFWKETKLHKVLGSFPAEYVMYSYEMEGLQKGSHKSMQIINDVLYFLGAHGVYAFAGGVPQLASQNFGEIQLEKGVAGTDGDTYYLSAMEGDEHHLLLYETNSGQWMKEDSTKAIDFARNGRDLYMLDDEGDVWLMDVKEDDPDLEWMAHFTPFYESIEGRKMFTKLLLRLELPKGAWMKTEIRCDDGLWRESGKVLGRDSDSVPLCLPINRCDKLEIRLSGQGPCTIKAMMLEYKMGSDV